MTPGLCGKQLQNYAVNRYKLCGKQLQDYAVKGYNTMR